MPRRIDMRMFVGIPLSSTQKDAIAHVMSRLPIPEASFRRSRPEGWHITLQFLGEVSPEQQGCLLLRLREVSSGPVRLRIARIGWLGTGILAAHVEPVPELGHLANEVAGATSLCGFQPDERPWRPHITLARRRAKARVSRKELAHLDTTIEEAFAKAGPEIRREFAASEICLFESFSDPHGQRYSVRARFPLERLPKSPSQS